MSYAKHLCQNETQINVNHWRARMPDENNPKIPMKYTAQEIKAQIATWANRMAMAKPYDNDELIEQALKSKQSYENQLARLQEFKLDEK